MTVEPRQPCIDWAKQVQPDPALPPGAFEPGLYLLPECETREEAIGLLEQGYEEIFCTELEAWSTDPATWPSLRTLALFQEWFAFRFFDLVGDQGQEPLTHDEADESFPEDLRGVILGIKARGLRRTSRASRGAQRSHASEDRLDDWRCTGALRKGGGGGNQAGTITTVAGRRRLKRWYNPRPGRCIDIDNFTAFQATMKKVVSASILATSALTLLVDTNAAKAALEYRIYESLGNLVVETSGSLSLPPASGTGNCGAAGVIALTLGYICTGPNVTQSLYQVSGPTTFTGSTDLYPATSVSGLISGIVAPIGRFVMENINTSGSPIASGSIFPGKTLADL